MPSESLPSGADRLGECWNAKSMGRIVILLVFVLSRSVHPLVIDISKIGGNIIYAKNAPVIVNKFVTVILMNLWAYCHGGRIAVRKCWHGDGVIVYGCIGMMYALGDFLEMLSMASLRGGVYQILLQSKLLVTALLLMKLKGKRHSTLQWHVLVACTLGISTFVLLDDDTGSNSNFPMVAVLAVVCKVVLSCWCGVVSDVQLKRFTDVPTSAKISQISFAWLLSSIVIAIVVEPELFQQGLFHNWTAATWMVMASFVVKSLITIFLLKALDSLQKNIGEAIAVLVIYGVQVALGATDFDLGCFLVAALVVILVRVYSLAGKLDKDRNCLPTPIAKIVATGALQEQCQVA